MSSADIILGQKVANAIAATRLFIAELESENQRRWAERYRKLVALLESGEAWEAVEYYQSITGFSGPGSLADIYPGNGHFEKHWGQCSTAIGHIRVFLKYGIDRPLVKLES